MHERGRPVRVSRQTLLVLALAAVLASIAVVVGAPLLTAPAHLPMLPIPWWAFAAAFAVVESVVFHVQFRREAQAVSLSELPLVLGLFFATPEDLLLGRLVGSALVFVAVRRSSPLKTVFNLALVGAETVVAVAVFRAVAAWGDGVGPVSWLAAYAGVLLAEALSAVVIGVVITVYEGGLHIGALLREAVTGQQAAPMVITLALVAVISLTASVQSAWLLLASAVVLLVAYRAYAALSDRHLSLERLYQFSQAVTSSPEVDEVLRSVLDEARQLLRSERGEVVFMTSLSGGIARVQLGAGGRLSRSEGAQQAGDRWLLVQVVDGGVPLLVPRGSRDEAGRWLQEQGLREAIAVPLRGGAGVIGALMVGDRLGEVRTYDQDDVRLLETVANHASIALENGELIGRLRHEALHDALTGLPNRVQLQRELAAALEEVRNGRAAGTAVMILDLDGFKDVNDTLGHQQGDALLVEVGARLRTAVGDAGTVARLGGDEFAILVPGGADEQQVLRIGRRLLTALEQPVALEGMEVEIGGSLGVAMAPAHAGDPALLLKRADLAMYDAKGSARGLRLYEPDLDSGNPRRLALVAELRAALQHDALQVHVQPKALLGTGEVVGVEALVRWVHPEMGSVPPDEFIPVAERSGLIGPLTAQVLDRALAACASWREQGRDLGVAVNLSTRSLHDADLVDEVARALRRYELPAHRLTLEVTEGSVMADPARAVALLHELRDLGVRLSVDDFGTGYSSLSYLKRLPVQEVKIDRSFITGLRHGSDDLAIVRAIVDLGRHLNLQVVAEGVEDQETWDLLAAMGCDLAQGWLLSRAVPTAELMPWLLSRAGADVTAGRGLRAL